MADVRILLPILRARAGARLRGPHLHIGLEDVEDLVADLERGSAALAAAVSR